MGGAEWRRQMALLAPRPIPAGSGAVVVPPHGVSVASRMWNGIAGPAERFERLTHDFSVEAEIDGLADQLAAVLTAARIARARIVGSSPGGMGPRIRAGRSSGRGDGTARLGHASDAGFPGLRIPQRSPPMLPLAVRRVSA